MNPTSAPELVLRASPASDSVAELGESPLWDNGAGLRWLDISGQRMFTLDLGGREESIELSSAATAVELGPDRRLLAVTSTGFGWLDAETGQIDQVLEVLNDESMTMNDGAIDPCGRCWAGSAMRDGSRSAALYRLDCSGVSSQLQAVGMSNGIDFSPAGDVLYHVDTTSGTLIAWEYDLALGELGTGRVLRYVPTEVGLPDGIAVDADGNVWLAVWGQGQVWRIDPSTGEITAIVEVPTPCTTSCAFGGPNLSTLYITSANYEQPRGGGLLYAVEVPAQGRHPHRFTGALP